MTESMTPKSMTPTGKLWALVVPAAFLTTGLPSGRPSRAAAALSAQRQRGDVLLGGYAGSHRTGGADAVGGAPIPNPPVTGVLPVRRQVLTS